jgi:hypothetical protein
MQILSRFQWNSARCLGPLMTHRNRSSCKLLLLLLSGGALQTVCSRMGLLGDCAAHCIVDTALNNTSADASQGFSYCIINRVNGALLRLAFRYFHQRIQHWTTGPRWYKSDPCVVVKTPLLSKNSCHYLMFLWVGSLCPRICGSNLHAISFSLCLRKARIRCKPNGSIHQQLM